MLGRSDGIGDSERWRHIAGSGWLRRCGAVRANAKPRSKQLPDIRAGERAESGAACGRNGSCAWDAVGAVEDRHADRLHRVFWTGGERAEHGVCDLGWNAGRDWEESE